MRVEKAGNPEKEKEKATYIPRWQSCAVAAVARLAFLSCRKKIIDPAECRKRVVNEPFIFVGWHNRLLFAPFCIPRKIRPRTAALASHSKDGEYAAAYVREFSAKVVRGSSSRGGYRAIVDMLRQFGIREMVRTGKISLARGPKTTKAD